MRISDWSSDVCSSDLVARVEIGNEDYNFNLELNGKPASGLILKLAPGANAVQTVDLVKARIAELQKQFPPDIRVVYPLDSTPFVRLSIEQEIGRAHV